MSGLWFIGLEAIEVLFSNGDALAAKNGIGRGHMKEEAGQCVLQPLALQTRLRQSF